MTCAQHCRCPRCCDVSDPDRHVPCPGCHGRFSVEKQLAEAIAFARTDVHYAMPTSSEPNAPWWCAACKTSWTVDAAFPGPQSQGSLAGRAWECLLDQHALNLDRRWLLSGDVARPPLARCGQCEGGLDGRKKLCRVHELLVVIAVEQLPQQLLRRRQREPRGRRLVLLLWRGRERCTCARKLR